MSAGGPVLAAAAAEIVSVGLVTPLGLHAAAVSAAVRAGLSRARRTPVIGRVLDRQAMHLAESEYLEPLNPALSPDGMTSPHERMLRLAGPALAEAAAAYPEPVPLYLALPEVLPGTPDPLGPPFLQQLAVQSSVKVNEKQSVAYRQGGAAVLLALRDALAVLARREASHVIVGGVDTFLDAARICTLHSENRLIGPTSRLGFMPGEGAGFLMLRSARPPQESHQQLGPTAAPALARVIGVGTGAEKGHRYSKEPYRGDGLAEAFEALFQGVPSTNPKVQCVYAGFNGEEMPAKEWGVARLRNTQRFAAKLRVDHPAEYIGDSGAALGAIMLGLAAVAIAKGHLPEPRPIWASEDPGPCLVWSTSDRAPRAAALLQW